jgi:hypothetical protein
MKYLIAILFSISFLASFGQAAEPANPNQLPSADDAIPAAQILKFQGRNPSTISIVNGFGKSIPLMEATKLILPTGVVVIFDESVSSSNAKVSWRGGNTWLVTLAQILHQARASAVMNFDSMQLTITSFDLQMQIAQTAPPKISHQAEIIGVRQAGAIVMVTLANQVAEIYIVDRLRQQDIQVNWVSPTMFTFPASVSDKIRITTDKGASNITRLNGNWIIGGA